MSSSHLAQGLVETHVSSWQFTMEFGPLYSDGGLSELF
jgi:hypothetical protein